MRAEDKILHKLIDRYERAELRNKEVERVIREKIDNKSLPVYFDLKNTEFEDINSRLVNLEQDGAIEIKWKDNRRGHIIESIRLKDSAVLYPYLKRQSLVLQLKELKDLILNLKAEYSDSKLTVFFLDDILERLDKNLSIKKLVDISDLSEFKDFTKLLYLVDKNEESCFIREFSVKHFSNSKFLDAHLVKLINTIKRYYPEFEENDKYQVLGNFNIEPNPTYLYLKGEGKISIAGNTLELSTLTNGIALSEEDIKKIRFIDLENVSKVLTIENLTSFYRYSEEGTICVYTGGFHNRIHREFLKRLYDYKDDIDYCHFGDIDVGGYHILLDLIKKTGIPFRAQDMDDHILERFNKYSNELTKEDIKRLKGLIAEIKEASYLEKEEREKYIKTLNTMLKSGKKLEQESLFWKEK